MLVPPFAPLPWVVQQQLPEVFQVRQQEVPEVELGTLDWVVLDEFAGFQLLVLGVKKHFQKFLT